MTILSQAAFARHLGVVKSYVTLLKQQGRLVMTDDGKVDVEASEAKIKATEDPGKSGVAERHSKNREAGQGAAAVDDKKQEKTASQEMAEKTSMTYQQSRAVKERYAALQAKADYESFIGKLVDASQARAVGAEIGVMFRNALESWPDTVGPGLVGLDEIAIRSILVEHAEALLHSIEHRIKTLLAERSNEN